MRHLSSWLLSAGLLLGGCIGAEDDGSGDTGEALMSDVAPSGRDTTIDLAGSVNVDKPGEAAAARVVRGNGINYHGGPIILGTTNVHFI